MSAYITMSKVPFTTISSSLVLHNLTKLFADVLSDPLDVIPSLETEMNTGVSCSGDEDAKLTERVLGKVGLLGKVPIRANFNSLRVANS